MLTEALKDVLDEPSDPTDLDQMLPAPPGAIGGGGGGKLPGGGAGASSGLPAEMMMVE